ncbi:MAG: DUF4177 domain-containing protein [Chitinophagaceae bacterium]|nr:DUF4177 domain-containing protein [Anaerolineae bacterium]
MEGSAVAQEHPEVDVYLDADKFTEKLNTYGKAGWELTSFEWTDHGAKASFKRAVQS